MSKRSKADEILRLSELVDQGKLSEEEFIKERQKILNDEYTYIEESYTDEIDTEEDSEGIEVEVEEVEVEEIQREDSKSNNNGNDWASYTSNSTNYTRRTNEPIFIILGVVIFCSLVFLSLGSSSI